MNKIPEMRRLFNIFRVNAISCLMVLVLSGVVSGCDPASPATALLILEGKTMGTFWRVNLAGVDPKKADVLQKQIQAQLDEDDQLLSTWKSDSALSRFNQYCGKAPQPVNEAIADIVTLALRVGKKTQGAMDITAGSLVNLWGFGPYPAPDAAPAFKDIEVAKALTGLSHLRVLQTDEGQFLQKDLAQLYVDLSTLGEGYATDHLAHFLEKQGIFNYLVSVGGVVLAKGQNVQGKPWRVAIEQPNDRVRAIQAEIDLKGQATSTSGSYRNYYEINGKRFSHVIDPKTGSPINHTLVSATVIAPTALEADAWDTGLMVVGPEKAKLLAIKENLAVYLIIKEKEEWTTWMSPQFASFLIKENQ